MLASAESARGRAAGVVHHCGHGEDVVSKEHRTLGRALSRLAAVLVGIVVVVSSANAGDPELDAHPAAETGPDTALVVGDSLVSCLLADTSWHLVEFRSMDDETGVLRPDEPGLYTMYLGGDLRVAMRLNCNRASGEWFMEPSRDGTSGSFRFGPLSATSALCPPPSMDERIAADSEFVRSYLLKEGKLYLSLMADGGIYTWQADAVVSPLLVPFAAAEDGGPRNWVVHEGPESVSLLESPSVDARVVTDYAPGTVLDNLGCQSEGGRDWCDVQELGGGPRGYVEAAFLYPAVSPDGSIRLGPDDSALRAGLGDFDATGSIPCAEHLGQPMVNCEFGVARAGGGYATVVITRPDGRPRAIYFRMGVPIGADTSQADGYPEFTATKELDLHFIRIGHERYEIPDAVIVGG